MLAQVSQTGASGASFPFQTSTSVSKRCLPANLALCAVTQSAVSLALVHEALPKSMVNAWKRKNTTET